MGLVTYGKKRIAKPKANQWDQLVNVGKKVEPVIGLNLSVDKDIRDGHEPQDAIETANRSDDDDTLQETDNLSKRLSKTADQVLDEIVKEKKPKRIVKRSRSNASVGKSTKRSNSAAMKDAKESSQSILNKNVNSEDSETKEIQLEVLGEETTASDPLDIPHMKSLIPANSGHAKDMLSDSMAIEPIQSPLPSIRTKVIHHNNPFISTPAKSTSLDFGDVSPISGIANDLKSSTLSSPLSKDSDKTELSSAFASEEGTRSDVTTEVMVSTSPPNFADQKPPLPNIPIKLHSPKVQKRVGRLGLAKQNKMASKLSFDLVRSSSQSSVDVERNPSPGTEPHSSPPKTNDEFAKREVIMAVRNTRTVVTYGRGKESGPPITDFSVPDLPSNDQMESDNEDVDMLDEGLESSDDESKPRVRGIHELRVAGNSKRTRDELEYISEGLGSPLLNIRRSTGFDILKKLKDTPFVTNIRIHGYLNKLFEIAKKNDDPILHVTLCYIICFLGNDVRNFECLEKIQMVMWILGSITNFLERNILVQLPKKRFDKTLVQELIQHIRDLGTFEPDPIDIPFHLKLLVMQLVDGDQKLSLNWKPSTILFQDICHSLEGVELPFSPKTTSSLVILDLLSRSPNGAPQVYHENAVTTILWKRFANAFNSLSKVNQENEMKICKATQKIIKILLNYHGPKLRIPGMVQQDSVDVLLSAMLFSQKKQHDTHDLWFDLHLLILGLFINILESEGKHIEMLYEKIYNSEGDIVKSNARLKSKYSAFEMIATSFQVVAADKDPTIAMKSAYHAILIGKMVYLNPSKKGDLLDLMPEDSVAKLIELIEDFALYHQAIESDSDSKDSARQSLDSILAILHSTDPCA